MTPVEFRAANPGLFFLEPVNLTSLVAYLRLQALLAPGEVVVTAGRAGEGNMNCTVRVHTTMRTFIMKQARPWVEKYPQIAAPWDRACREAEFYQKIAGCPPVASMMPRLIAFDPAARVLVLEDLGTDGDYTDVYRGGKFQPAEIKALAGWLSALHGRFQSDTGSPAITNREMRELNHAHIFTVPLAMNNGLELDTITDGLTEDADLLKHDPAYCAEVARLGRETYLSDGPCLLQGDFFPGSFIRTPNGPRVIDPEFGFFGRPEFDVAVLVAHLVLAAEPAALRAQLRRDYAALASFDDALVMQLAGVELMRRLIGYAQLPLTATRRRKRDWLMLSRELVLRPHRDLIELD